MTKMYFILPTILLTLNCANRTQNQSDNSDGALQEVKMSFPWKMFPWKDGVDAATQQKFFQTLSFGFQASRSSDQKDPCKEAPSQKLVVDPKDQNVNIKGVQLTKKCSYDMLMEISDDTNIYFKTDTASIKQTVLDDGKIQKYELCIVNGGTMFDTTKAKACPATADKPKLTGSGKTQDDPMKLSLHEALVLLSNTQESELSSYKDSTIREATRKILEKFRGLNIEGLYISFEGFYMKSWIGNGIAPSGQFCENQDVSQCKDEAPLGFFNIIVSYPIDKYGNTNSDFYINLKPGVNTKVVGRFKSVNDGSGTNPFSKEKIYPIFAISLTQ